MARRSRIATFLACLAIVAQARPADAHAVLTSTEPASSTTVTRAPDVVRLVFNERVESAFNAVRVLDADGRRRDSGRAGVVDGGAVVEVPVEPLSPGAYTVVWRVNSVDGHQIRGYFGFGVGAPPPLEQAMLAASVTRPDPAWELAVGAVKTMGLLALVVWLGAWWCARGLFARSRTTLTAGDTKAVASRLAGLGACASTTFVIVEACGLVNHAAVLADTRWLDAVSPATLAMVVTQTSVGGWRALRLAVALALCAWTAVSRTGTGDRVRPAMAGTVAASMAALLLATYPLTGHAGAVDRYAGLALAADWLHLAATSVWLGGLAALVFVCGRPLDVGGADVLRQLVPRFSRVALACVLVLVVTGAYAAWLHVPNARSIVDTTYGRALGLKLSVFLAMVVVAAYNRRVALPRLVSAPASAAALVLRRWMRTEVALACVLIAAVAWLTSVPPASASAASGPLDRTMVHGALRVGLAVHPNRVGQNHAVVTVREASGAAVDVAGVTVYVRTRDADTGLQTYEAERDAGGTFVALPVVQAAGRGTVSVQVTPRAADAFLVEFETFWVQ